MHEEQSFGDYLKQQLPHMYQMPLTKKLCSLPKEFTKKLRTTLRINKNYITAQRYLICHCNGEAVRFLRQGSRFLCYLIELRASNC
jgi:hypothetical protein